LLESGVRDLGIHSEMMAEGMVELCKAGRVTGARKTIDRGKHVYSFALGSRDLYATLDRNPDMRAMPLEYTNLPHMIMQNENVLAINAMTQIDLQGQAASESDGNRHISGTGGQAQFVRGAYASKGGKSFKGGGAWRSASAGRCSAASEPVFGPDRLHLLVGRKFATSGGSFRDGDCDPLVEC
jgi:acyl-CoA hydrolase